MSSEALAKEGLFIILYSFMYYVYIVRSLEKQDELYTWFSENLKQRIENQNIHKNINLGN